MNIKRNGAVFLFWMFALSSCTSSAQVGSIRVLEEGQNRSYTRIKTPLFKNEATILKDTLDNFNRYPPKLAISQYIPTLADVATCDAFLSNISLKEDQITETSLGISFLKTYRGFKRQYSGFLDKVGDTIIVVTLLDFNKVRKAKDFFPDWKYRNGYLSSGLFLERKAPSIHNYSFNKRTKDIRRYFL